MEPNGHGLSLIVFETLAIVLQAASVLLNGAIVSTLWKRSLFKCPSNKFVFSLCLAHFLVSILSLLISVTQSFVSPPSGRPPSSLHDPRSGLEVSYLLSHGLLYLTLCVATGTCLTVAFISVERYITIARPMKYKSIVTRRRCTGVILSTWLLSALITLAPVLIFGNETVLHGTIAIPARSLGLYFGILLTALTTVVLLVMILCYAKIFKIAREKCQKVQIGHFTSPVSSISSDWPSSVCSSHQEVGLGPAAASSLHKWFNGPSHSHSLLQYVLMANLGKTSVTSPPAAGPPRDPYVLTLAGLQHVEQEITLRSGGPDVRSGSSRPFQPKGRQPKTWTPRRRWRTFLQHNYNSPRKTVSTIFLLIGSLGLTQFPLGLLLFQAHASPALFHFAFKILFGLSSVSSPVLYGFLNRTIRASLWKFLRLGRARSRRKAFDLHHQRDFDSRKASISSGDSNLFPQNKRRGSSLTGADGLAVGQNKEGLESWRASDESQGGTKPKGLPIEDIVQITNSMPIPNKLAEVPEEGDEDALSSSFPRKPSQDSGADVEFSDEDDDEREVDGQDPHANTKAEGLINSQRSSRSEGQDSDEEEDEDFDDDEDFERMKDLIRKKFSITGEDDCCYGIRNQPGAYFDPIEV